MNKMSKESVDLEIVKEAVTGSDDELQRLHDEKLQSIPVMASPTGLFSFLKKKQYYKAQVKLHCEFHPKEIDFRSGVPVVFLDIEDMMPMYLTNEKLDQEPKSRNPYQVEAVLGKEIAAAELEALKMTKKNIQMMLILLAVMGVIVIGVSYMGYDNTQKIGSMVYNLTQRIPAEMVVNP
jgi:hypothetical protein